MRNWFLLAVVVVGVIAGGCAKSDLYDSDVVALVRAKPTITPYLPAVQWVVAHQDERTSDAFGRVVVVAEGRDMEPISCMVIPWQNFSKGQEVKLFTIVNSRFVSGGRDAMVVAMPPTAVK